MSKESQEENNAKQKPWIEPLLNYFNTIKTFNDKIESIREKLCSIENFNPNQLFDFLDYNINGFLISKNLINFLKESNKKFEEQNINCLIHNYDKDSDFTLNKKEFLKIVLPNKNKNVREKILSVVKSDSNLSELTNEMQNIFIELINEELNLIETSFYIIKNIYGSPKFTIYEAFLDIVKKESYITRENLKSFFIENSIELDDDDIYMMMFRIDSDDDNRISYVEFQKIFYPLKDLENYNNNNLIKNEKSSTFIKNKNLKVNLNSDSKNIIYDITSTPKVLKQNKDQSNYSDYKGLMNENSKNNKIYNKLGKIDESEDIIKKTERKYSLGFTDYTTERKKDTSSKKNLLTDEKINEIKNLKRQICFKFMIEGVNKPEFEFKTENKNNSFTNNYISIKDNNYNYNPPQSEKLFIRNNEFYSLDKVNNNNINLKAPYLHYEYIDDNLKEAENNRNEIKNLNNDVKNDNNNIIDNNFVINDDNNYNESLYRTPKTTRNNPSFVFQKNYPIYFQASERVSNGSNLNVNKISQKQSSSRIVIKNDALFDLLNDYINQDTIIQNILEKLAACPDFNLINLFQNFLNDDYLNRRIVTANDIFKTLTSMCLNINPKDIKYIYIKFNKDLNQEQDSGFTYSEFCNMMSPKKYHLSKLLDKRENKRYFMGFNFKTKRLIYSAFKQFIDSEKSNEKYRKELIGNDHNIYKIYVCMENLFNSLKKNYNNGLDQEDVCNFMETNGRKLCQYEIDLLMEKFDKNKDGLIDFDEFFSEISPKI